MLNFLLWIIVGGSAGWLASLLLCLAAYRETGLNILTRIEGTTLAGLVLSPLFGVTTCSRRPSTLVLLFALGGTLLLLSGGNWFWCHRVGPRATDVSNLWPIGALFRGVCQAVGLALNKGGHRTLCIRSDATCLLPAKPDHQIGLDTLYPLDSAEACQQSTLQKAKRQQQRQTRLAAMTHRAEEIGARNPQTAQRVSKLGLLVLAYLDTQAAWSEGRQKQLVAVRVIADNLGLPHSSIQAACTKLAACQLVNAYFDGTRQSYGIRLDAWPTIERLE